MAQSQLPWWITAPNPNIYLGDNYLVLDFETSNIDKGSALNPKNTLVCGVWKYKGQLKHIVGNEFEYEELLKDIEESDFIVCHNAKFELQWLQRCGLDLRKVIVYDTQIGEYVLLGNRNDSLDLDSVAHRYAVGGKLGLVSRLIHNGVCPSTMPLTWLVEYNKQDVVITERVFRFQRTKLDELGLLPTAYTRCLLTPVLADIERYGMMVDSERVTKIYNRLSKEYEVVINELNSCTGGINPRSGQQVAEFLYGTLRFDEVRDSAGKPRKTESGRSLTDLSTILSLVPSNDAQRKFLELKKKQSYLESKLTKSFAKFYECLSDEENPGLIHFRFNQTVTQTHRLSSSGAKYKIQGQNLDRDVKPVFKARFPGWLIGEIDQAQLEFRAAGQLSQDSVVIKSIIDKEDIHKYTASVLNKIPLELVTSDQRQDAKPETFKPLYGGEYGSPEQMAYYEAFRAKYPELNETQENWVTQVLATGKLITATGLIFYWPGTKIEMRWSKRYKCKVPYVEHKRSIYNYPIQSIATADVVPIGVVCLWHRMGSVGMKSFLNNTVHDSAIVEVHPEEVDLFKVIGEEAFVTDTYKYLKDCYGIDWNVPLEVETIIGPFWKDSSKWCDKWLNNNNKEKENIG